MEVSIMFEDMMNEINRKYDVDCIWGSDVEGEVVPISSLKERSKRVVCIEGRLADLAVGNEENGTIPLFCTLSDETGVIGLSLLIWYGEKQYVLEDIKVGKTYIVKGLVENDLSNNKSFFTSIWGIKPVEE